MATADQYKPHPDPDGWNGAINFLSPTIASSRSRLAAMTPDQNTEYILLSDFNAYCEKTLKNTLQLEGETLEQYRQRMSWAIQASAIEIASKDVRLRSDPARVAWKTELTGEILQAIQQTPNLPGIEVSYEQPLPGERVDQYSTLRMIMKFSNITSSIYDGDPTPLHISARYNTLYNTVGQLIVENQIKEGSPEPQTALSYAKRLLFEISSIYGDENLEDKQSAILAIRRLAQFANVIRNNPYLLDNQVKISHRLSGGKYHAFLIDLFDVSTESCMMTLQIEPDEVTNGIWEFLREACSHASTEIPQREMCLPPKPSRRSHDNEPPWKKKRKHS